MQSRTNRVLLVLLALLFQHLSAYADVCDKAQNDGDAFVGVYAEWPGLSDAQSREHEQSLLNYLNNYFDSDELLSVCSITKTVFPPLGAVNLFDIKPVRKMLTGQLSDKETFPWKLEQFRIKYLVFVTAASGSSARFNVVRIDPSGQYPKKGFFVPGDMPRFDTSLRNEFFAQVAHGVKQLSKPAPQKYPVVVACFVDGIGRSAPPEWKMDQLKTLIPKGLTVSLIREKPSFETSFPIWFDDKCPFVGLEQHPYAAKFEDRWFAWIGTIRLVEGSTVNVTIDFHHSVEQVPVQSDPAEWNRDMKDVNIEKLYNDKSLIELIVKKWNLYLKLVSKRRDDLPIE